MNYLLDRYLIWFKLAGYLIVALAAWYAWNQFTGHYKEQGRVEVRKELQPKLDDANHKNKILEDSLKVQNEAFSKLADDNKKAVDDAEKRYLEAYKKVVSLSRDLSDKKVAVKGLNVRNSQECEVNMQSIGKILENGR